jgi:hypothetical protein
MLSSVESPFFPLNYQLPGDILFRIETKNDPLVVLILEANISILKIASQRNISTQITQVST